MTPNNPNKPTLLTYDGPPQPHDGRATVATARPSKLLRLPLVEERTGLRKSSLYAGAKAGTFPAPVRLSARAVAWREEDIDRWVSQRIKVGGQS